MAETQVDRPRFYQGQYLGPEELSASVNHGRWARARHDLAVHAWGVGVGLDLREVEALGGIEVFVDPGYAVDGFGRPLVVTSAVPVSTEALSRLSLTPSPGETSLLVPVWLRYMEDLGGEPGFGFEVCEADDAYGRIAESFEVLVGARALAEQRDPVVVDGQEIDALEALRTSIDSAPMLCDGSVPFQTFPDTPDRWWLIPVGFVRWEPGPPGRLLNTTEADRRESRRFRRYVGVVAEGVYAADSVIRLRRRHVDQPPGAVSAQDACADAWPRAQSPLDLSYDAATERVTATELVWVEGHLRVVGDTRLFGGQLELRDEHGDDRSTPMWVRRVESNSFLDPSGNALSGRDLEVLIGQTSDPDGRNRLVIGAAPADPAEVAGQVVVQNDGRVGIGTLDPPTPLSAPLTIRGIGTAEELIRFEAPDGTPSWHLDQNLAGSADGLNFAETGVMDGRLFLQAGGRVGLSTTNPEARLDIAGAPASSGALWLRVGDGGDSGRVWIEYGSQNAPLMVLSDLDDPPRLRFQQIGSASETSPQHSSWIGHARGGSPDLALIGGRLGVGTTTPAAPLHVGAGSDVRLATAESGFLLLGSPTGLNIVMDDNEIMARNNGALSGLHFQADGGDVVIHGNLPPSERVVVRGTGQVGIGTNAPADRLEVRGNIRLGAAGDLFAVGALQNLHMIAGRVSAAGVPVNGLGFNATRNSGGRYTVTFSAFDAVPIVLVTPVDVASEDRVITVHSVAVGSFEVACRDVAPAQEGQLLDTAFTFIALGLRT